MLIRQVASHWLIDELYGAGHLTHPLLAGCAIRKADCWHAPRTAAPMCVCTFPCVPTTQLLDPQLYAHLEQADALSFFFTFRW